MRLITEADSLRGVIKADDDGQMWLWTRSDGNGSVWAQAFNKFPYRNDVHRLMSQIKRTE